MRINCKTAPERMILLVLMDDFEKENLLNFGKVLGNQNENLSIETATPHKNVPTIAPFGVAALPPIGADAMTLQAGDRTFCVGGQMKNKNLKPGEILIYSEGGASIFLDAEGGVSICSAGGAKIVLTKTGEVEVVQKNRGA